MWRYFKYFEVVAQEQHFGRAAEMLYISQSALSKAMDNLEKELGFPLFEKQGRNAKLTRYGEIMYDHVCSAVKEIENGVRHVQMLTDSSSGSLRFASIYTMGSYIPSLIKQFISEWPEAKLYYTQKSTTHILNDLLDDKIDIGFCGEYDRSNQAYAGLDREAVLVEELYLYVPEHHPFAKVDEIDCCEILDEDFIGWSSATGISMSIERLLKKEGIQQDLNYRFFATEDNTVAEMVRQGLGIALMADSPAINTSGLHKIRLHHPNMKRALYMVWKRSDFCPPIVKTFRYFALSHKWDGSE